MYHDVNLHADEKAKSVFIKLANFIRNNPAAPITVKRKILTSCLNASLLYGSEAWGGTSLQKIETLYRKAIKITFGMNKRAPMEIIFLETGLKQLKAEIYKRQYKFWSNILKKIECDPLSNISLIYKMAIAKNLHYVRHYRKLHNTFSNSDICYRFYSNEFNVKLRNDISIKTAAQTYGILTDYMFIIS